MSKQKLLSQEGITQQENSRALTLFDEQVGEGEDDGVAAVQVVPTHVVGARDGQASASNQLHYPSQVRFPVSKELVEEQNTKAQ